MQDTKLEAPLQGSEETDDYLDADDEHDRGEIECASAESDRRDDPSQRKDHRIDDSVQEGPQSPQRVRRRNLNPRHDDPGDNTVKVDCECSRDEVGDHDSVDVVEFVGPERRKPSLLVPAEGHPGWED